MSGDYYPIKCTECNWTGSSEHAAGGGQIADTGDYNELMCPKCWAWVDEIEQDEGSTSNDN